MKKCKSFRRGSIWKKERKEKRREEGEWVDWKK